MKNRKLNVQNVNLDQVTIGGNRSVKLADAIALIGETVMHRATGEVLEITSMYVGTDGDPKVRTKDARFYSPDSVTILSTDRAKKALERIRIRLEAAVNSPNICDEATTQGFAKDFEYLMWYLNSQG